MTTSSLQNLKHFQQVLSKTKKIISTDLKEQKDICVGVNSGQYIT